MDKKTTLKLKVSSGITIILAVVFIFLTHTKPYQILELKALDLRFVLKGSKISSLPVVHIDIDDKSLSLLGRWPWPRAYQAKLVEALKEAQAKQIIFDILFLERQKDNPSDDKTFAKAIKESGIVYLPFYYSKYEINPQDPLRKILSKDISVTVDKASSMLNLKVEDIKERYFSLKKDIIEETVEEIILKNPDISVESLLEQLEVQYKWAIFPEDEEYINSIFSDNKQSRAYVNKFSISLPASGWPFIQEDIRLNVPLQEYYDNVKGSGFINADADIDGITRKVPLFIRHENYIFPQVTVSALMSSLGVKEISAQKSRIILRKAAIGNSLKDIVIPVDRNGRMLINWQGRWDKSFGHIPYHLISSLSDIRGQLSEANITPEADYLKKTEAALKAKLTSMVKDKVCIVGLTATGTHDLKPIPLQENYPMVGLHSNLIQTIVSGNFITEKRGFTTIFIFFFTALFVSLCSLIKLGKSLILSLVYCLAYALACFLVFIYLGWWIDFVGPLGIVIFGFAGVTSFRFFTEEKEKLWIRKAFSHYLSGEVINELINDPSRLKLGGERRNITVFFSDVRGFTSFSESQQPEAVVSRLNEILTAQVKVVFKYNGTLDKFVGDELMAFFGAPGILHKDNHPLIAVRTAVEIQQSMRKLQEQWTNEGKAPLYIGIGINTGDMVMGNMGSAERMDFTVIGDNVNLAARLCSAAGKDEIIISESTYEPIKDHIEAVRLEPIMVKGKAKPIVIYKVVGLK